MTKKRIQFVFAPIFLSNGLSFLALFLTDCVGWPALPVFAAHHALALTLAVTSLFLALLYGVLGIVSLLSPGKKTPHQWIIQMRSLLQSLCYGIWAWWGLASLGKVADTALGIASLLAFVIYGVFSSAAQLLDKPDSKAPRPV